MISARREVLTTAKCVKEYLILSISMLNKHMFRVHMSNLELEASIFQKDIRALEKVFRYTPLEPIMDLNEEFRGEIML